MLEEKRVKAEQKLKNIIGDISIIEGQNGYNNSRNSSNFTLINLQGEGIFKFSYCILKRCSKWYF
jgi:hypothetical protein